MTIAAPFRNCASLFATACLGLALAPAARAQQALSSGSLIASAEPIMLPTSQLPDSPGTLYASSSSRASLGDVAAPQSRSASHAVAEPMATPTDKYIAPGQSVPSLTVGNKVVLGIKDAISPLSFFGWALSAGYEQATNGSPNYGTNGKAFAQRFGASAARATSEGIFSDSVLAPILREDPRYYRMGPGHGVFKRAAYAATRTLITRTDSGRATPNLAQLGGNLAGAYLTKAYYPDLNTTNTEVLKTFGGSVGGSALGFAVSEFLSGTLNFLHIDHPTRQ